MKINAIKHNDSLAAKIYDSDKLSSTVILSDKFSFGTIYHHSELQQSLWQDHNQLNLTKQYTQD